MKVLAFSSLGVALAAFVSGCASTNGNDDDSIAGVRWVVVSTNEPISSDRIGRGDEAEENRPAPSRRPSVLLAPENQDARAEIENAGLPPVLKKKMLDGDVLTVVDLEDLGRYKIGEATILKYLRATGAIYILKTDDINRLQQAGVSKAVIDYLLATANEPPRRVVRRYYHHYYHYDPWYYPHYHHYHYYHVPRHYHYRGGGGLRVYRPR